MCCIFTCCGWIVDLVQRVWTFSMSCIIMSAVSAVLATASLSGIALGYNYSLAEYIDLKETNVSVYLKRGVFDDEIADDMEWRRAGHLPVAGQIRDDNLRTGAPEDDDSTTLRSGRRLDDSVFEAEDQHKYEGSLMKLTAKPVYQDTPGIQITADLEMAEAVTKHISGSLDQLKAIQSLIDSRRAMATGGTTLSPMATYASEDNLLPYLPNNNNPNIPMHPEVQYRRMMAPGYNFRRNNNIEPGPARSQPVPELNPARLAVPDPANLNSQVNWLGPKAPGIYIQSIMPEFFISSPTYPTPITVRPVTVRPAVSDSRRFPDGVIFPYGYSSKKASSTHSPLMQPLVQSDQEQMDKQPDFYNEKILLESEEMSKNDNIVMPRMGMKSPEEEYEDEIKGLPVRKRRSVVSILVGEGKNPTEGNVIQPVGSKSPRNNDNLSSVKNIFTTTFRTTGNNMDTNYESYLTIDKSRSMVKEINDSQIGTNIFNKYTTNQQMDVPEKRKSNLVKQVEIICKLDPSEDKKERSLLEHLITIIGNNEARLVAETTPEANSIKSTAKKIRIKTRRKSFESNIVSSKYVPNNAAIKVVKKQPFSNQEILNSISVGLNEAGLLRNPSSSTFVKLLQATLTA